MFLNVFFIVENTNGVFTEQAELPPQVDVCVSENNYIYIHLKYDKSHNRHFFSVSCFSTFTNLYLFGSKKT